jgi:hypothetical protein
VDKELTQILPPLMVGAALVLAAVLVFRICLSVWARRRSGRQSASLPVQPVFPPPSHHERLRDPRYLGKILDGDDANSGSSRH